MKSILGVVGGAVALIALSCAGGETGGEASSSGSGGSTSSSGDGGTGGTTSTSSGGGQGGDPGPCAVDCTQIQAPDCQVSQCNAQTGQCEIVPDQDGTVCEDGLFCTANDECAAGICVPGLANDCGISPAACEAITCDENSQTCSTVASQNGDPCTDPNDLCIENGACTNGSCLGTPKDCFMQPVPDDCHVSECNPQNGQCEPVIGNEGGPCADANDLCTVTKTCVNGVCQGGSPMNCSQLTQGCVLGVCDVNNGQCTTQNLNNGDPCDDLNACTSGETCQNGGCSNGTPVVQCIGNDNCCPNNCTVQNDADCAQPVLYGYSTEFSTASSHSANYLLGNAIMVSSAMTLTHLSLISKQAGPNVKAGLYTDQSGNPGTLVASVGSTPVVVGVNELAVSPMSLPAGTYWFMAVFSASASVGIQHNVTSDVVMYTSHSFASALPTTFPSPSTYTGQGFNYYVKGLP
ncbi:MAG: hypothetical protein JRI68_29845 [Deltaproteobacteria bacterium]|nr:hypothetical protein [Deltaproteobacteria bacterium]